jgi:hypothetical protein
VEGIAGTMTPEAVHLLFTLAPAMPAARGALRWRTPDPQKRGFWQQWAQRRVAQGAWDERLRPEGMALGWLLLAKSSAEEVTDGAHLISCLGSKDDLPRLLTEFDRILVEKRNDPVEQHAYPSPITASGGVLHAVQALYTREAPLPAAPKTAAERLYILWAVKKYADVRPQGWQAVAQELLKDPIPFVRSTALQGLPEPLDPEFIPPVARLMADSSDRVAGAATGVAMRSKRPEFGEPALNLLRKTKSTWLVGNAVAVARECGVTRDRWMAICIARLEEPGMTAVMYEQLLSVITEHGRSQSGDITPASAARLKVRWQAFLDANRTALRAGTRFTPGEPPVTADLLDPGTTLMRDDGKDWPAR